MANCDLYVAQIGDHNSLTNGILIDEVAIFDYERSLSEIQNYVGNQLSGYENGLLAYWNFNEGNGATSYDLGLTLLMEPLMQTMLMITNKTVPIVI